MRRVSKYNLFQKRKDGSRLAYNAISGALAVMSEENYQTYRRIERKISTDSAPVFEPEEQELLKQLEYASFVYSGDYDEIDKLYFIHHASRYDESNVGLVIAPTITGMVFQQRLLKHEQKWAMPE